MSNSYTPDQIRFIRMDIPDSKLILFFSGSIAPVVVSDDSYSSYWNQFLTNQSGSLLTAVSSSLGL